VGRSLGYAIEGQGVGGQGIQEVNHGSVSALASITYDCESG
jgi:hypothetical protein